MATQMHFLIGSYITVCSRIKHESSSSDEEHTAAELASSSHLPLLSSVSYKKTLRLTSEQLVSVLSSPSPTLWALAQPRPPGLSGFRDPGVPPMLRLRLQLWHLLYPTACCPPRDLTSPSRCLRFAPHVSCCPAGLRGVTSPVPALTLPWRLLSASVGGRRPEGVNLS